MTKNDESKDAPSTTKDDQRQQQALKIIVWGAMLLAIALGIWALFGDMALRLGATTGQFRLELMKILWQFLLLAVLGGAVGHFFNKHENSTRERKQREAKDEEKRAARSKALLETHSDLLHAYQEAKSIRRLLRALAREQTGNQVTVRRAEYNYLIRKLNEVQLRFEYYARLAKADPERFPEPDSESEKSPYKKSLDQVESYLNEIVDEFEEKAWLFFAEQEHPPLSKFTKLTEFIKKQEEEKEEEVSPFHGEFVKEFYGLLRGIESAARSS